MKSEKSRKVLDASPVERRQIGFPRLALKEAPRPCGSGSGYCRVHVPPLTTGWLHSLTKNTLIHIKDGALQAGDLSCSNLSIEVTTVRANSPLCPRLP
jgi:hypothetical protein